MRDTDTVQKSGLILVTIVFVPGVADSNPDGCAIALRDAGFDVTRMEERHRKRMIHLCPGGELMEATKAGVEDAIQMEIEPILARFGADWNECEPIRDDHMPFAILLPYAVD